MRIDGKRPLEVATVHGITHHRQPPQSVDEASSQDSTGGVRRLEILDVLLSERPAVVVDGGPDVAVSRPA